MAGELSQAALDVPQGKLSKAEAAAIVKEARERLEQSWQADKDNRQEAATDLKFLAGDQWPEWVKKEREAEGLPMLTINALPQFLRQVTNPIREADLSIKTAPVDSNSDPKIAKIYDGILKQIQYQSSAKAVFAQTCEHQSGCGIGWFQIVTAYVDDSAFDQELRIEGIRSPLAVYDDPAAVLPDRSDAMWRLICEMVPEATFKAKYPKASTAGVDKPSDGNESTLFWSDNDMVRVAHYWRKVPVKKMLGLLPSGETIETTDLSSVVKKAMGIVRERPCESFRVEMHVVSGTEVLEGPYQWPGKYLPQIPVIGSEIPVEKGVYRYGVIRFARDPQQLYNFNRTAAAIAIAQAPKQPWLLTAKQIQGYESLWNTANSKHRPYLIYNPDGANPPPQRTQGAEPAVAHANEALAADNDMKRTTGIYDASLGGKSNETSGVAINQRQIQGDTATYHYGDNLQRSLEHCGRVLIDLIPKIYDNERIIRILGDDDAEEFVPINKVIMGQDGMPVMMHDLSTGRFDVRVRIARSADSKRLETAQFVTEFAKMLDPPQRAAVMDIIAKNMDSPGADEIAKRLKNMVPAGVLVDPDDPNAPPAPDPTQDPAFQLEAAEKQAKTEKDLQTARKTAADAEAQEFENAMAMGQAQAGIHPMQQPPLQEKQFDAALSERDAERADRHRYEDRQWSVEDQRREAVQRPPAQ